MRNLRRVWPLSERRLGLQPRDADLEYFTFFILLDNGGPQQQETRSYPISRPGKIAMRRHIQNDLVAHRTG